MKNSSPRHGVSSMSPQGVVEKGVWHGDHGTRVQGGVEGQKGRMERRRRVQRGSAEVVERPDEAGRVASLAQVVREQ